MAITNCTIIETPICKQDDLIIDVAKKIREHLLRYIYVLDENNKPVGVISTTDMNNRVVAQGLDSKNTKAKEIMTNPIISIDINFDEKEAYKLCVKNDIALCPITKDEKFIGVITLNELLRNLTKIE